MLRIGLTGGIAAGKSTVARYLADLGAVVIDADEVAREVVEPGTPGLAAVVGAFGPGVLRPDGSLDRAALGRIVFADPAALARLNAIVHPLVGERTRDLIAALPDGTVLVHDIPLLVENGLTDRYDLVVVVDADPDERARRLVTERGLTPEEARARIAAQTGNEQRRAVADAWIDTTGTDADTRTQVATFWRTQVTPHLTSR